MKILCDCHCHTVASGHAYSTVAENAAEAGRKGLELLVITDHGPRMPGGPHPWHFHNLRVLPRLWGTVEVWKGAEANIVDFEGGLDLGGDDLRALELVVASFHTPFFPGSPSRTELTRAAVKAMAHPRVAVLGHPDDDRLPLDPEELARAAAGEGVLLEVNNSSLLPTSYRLNARENYRRLLDACVRYGAAIVLDSDAHIHLDVGRCDQSLPLVEGAGFPEALVASTSKERLRSMVKGGGISPLSGA